MSCWCCSTLQHPMPLLAAPDQNLLKPALGQHLLLASGTGQARAAMTAAHTLFRAPVSVNVQACRAHMRHAACRCDALDISSLLTDAAAAVVDDSFLRQAICESSSRRQQQHDHGLCCSCAVQVLQSRAILHLGACCRHVRHGGCQKCALGWATAALTLCFAAAAS